MAKNKNKNNKKQGNPDLQRTIGVFEYALSMIIIWIVAGVFTAYFYVFFQTNVTNIFFVFMMLIGAFVALLISLYLSGRAKQRGFTGKAKNSKKCKKKKK